MTIKDDLLLSLLGQLTDIQGQALVEDIALAWFNVVRKFAPLIGTHSVLLLFQRSLEQNVTTFAWLPDVILPSQPDTAVERLRLSMAARPADQVLAAHRAILTTFIDLMTTLIGARLTVQFLRAALPAANAGSNSEEKPDDRQT